MTRTRVAACAALGALVLAAPLAADDKAKSSESSYVTALRTCQAKPDPAERLACYDTAVAAMVSASSEGEVRVVDAEDVRQTVIALMGFTLDGIQFEMRMILRDVNFSVSVRSEVNHQIVQRFAAELKRYPHGFGAAASCSDTAVFWACTKVSVSWAASTSK